MDWVDFQHPGALKETKFEAGEEAQYVFGIQNLTDVVVLGQLSIAGLTVLDGKGIPVSGIIEQSAPAAFSQSSIWPKMTSEVTLNLRSSKSASAGEYTILPVLAWVPELMPVSEQGASYSVTLSED